MRRPVTPETVSDDDLVIVAEVASREGWSDLTRPPDFPAHPRTLAEAAAVARFARAAGAKAAHRTARPGLKLRLAVFTACVAVLGVCWWVSPTRTAIALLGAGAFCLFALRRRGRVKRRGALLPR